MKFSNTIKKITEIIDSPTVEPYIIEKVNQKTGDMEKIPIIPTFRNHMFQK